MFAEANLARWKSFIRAGHAAWQRADHAAAAREFDDAVREAEQILLHRSEDLPVARIYVTSCHHLTEAYRRLGLLDLAGRCARDAYQRLQQIIRDAALPLELRRCCADELGHALIPLLAELSRDPHSLPAAQKLMSEARQLTLLMRAPGTAEGASAALH